mmetsp:Transcript_4637/g.14086  ORF Transcript_4637/g.14086 Transcript_4637/m.14086 type:complete len:315 (+) Transcript_4637:979-1923(+)
MHELLNPAPHDLRPVRLAPELQGGLALQGPPAPRAAASAVQACERGLQVVLHDLVHDLNPPSLAPETLSGLLRVHLEFDQDVHRPDHDDVLCGAGKDAAHDGLAVDVLEDGLGELVELAQRGLQGEGLDPRPVHGVLPHQGDLLRDVLQVLVLSSDLGLAALHLRRLSLLRALHPSLVPAENLALVADLAECVHREVLPPLALPLREARKVFPEVALRAPLEEDQALLGLQAKQVPHPAVVHVPFQVESPHGLAPRLFVVLPAPQALPLHVILAKSGVLVVLELLLCGGGVPHRPARRPGGLLELPTPRRPRQH